MNTRYCARPNCGHPNQYTATKPNFCGACGTPFSAAFASVHAPVMAPAPTQTGSSYAPPAPAPVRHSHPAARPPRERTFQSARDQRRNPVQSVDNQTGDDDHFDDSPADRDAAYSEGLEIAATLDPATFGLKKAEQSVVRFGDMPNLRDAATKMSSEGGAAPKKRTVRVKKAQA